MVAVMSKYLVAVLSTLVVLLLVVVALGYWKMSGMQDTIDKQNVELGVVAAMSQAQEVKIVESKQVEEKLKVVTQDKIQVIKEYVYDNNKSDCGNAAAVLSASF